MSVAEKLTTIAENQRKVHEAGKRAEYDRFWDSYLAGLSFNPQTGYYDYQYAFAGRGWNDENAKPNQTIQPESANSMFAHTSITDISDWDIDFSKCKSFSQMCYSAYIQKIGVIDTRSASNIGYMCNNAIRLVEVEKVILKDDGTQIVHGMFGYCNSLVEVRFEGVIGKDITFSGSPLLSNETVQNIIDHLKDLTGATAQTLTLHADVKAKMSQAQKDAIAAKNWTLA